MIKEMIEQLQKDFSKNMAYPKIQKMSECEKFDLIKRCYDIDGDDYNENNVIKAYITFFGFGKLPVKMKGSKVFVDNKYEAWVEGNDEFDGFILPKYLFLKSKDDSKEYDLRNLNNELVTKCINE